MATAPVPRWQIDGVVMPRNPDTFDKKFDKANVSYVTMADGSQRRIIAPNLLTAAQLQVDWHMADVRLRNFVMQYMNNALHKVTLDQLLPPQQMYVYFDTPDLVGISGTTGKNAETYIDQRPGQGGVRWDIEITGRTDGPYNHSLYPIPSSTAPPSLASVTAWFGGPTGNPTLDYLPVWQGHTWNILFGAASGTSVLIYTENLGTAPWSPTIKFNGPFNTNLSLQAVYQDVDGSGLGVTFTYTGPNVALGDFLRFDTQKLRLYASVSGVVSEIYSFSLNATASGIPFPYWPPFPANPTGPYLTWTGGDTTHSSIDFSNAATSVFNYW